MMLTVGSFTSTAPTAHAVGLDSFYGTGMTSEKSIRDTVATHLDTQGIVYKSIVGATFFPKDAPLPFYPQGEGL